MKRIAWLAAAVALAATFFEPHWPLTRRLFDHVVVLDITQSMNVADMLQDGRPVSRLAFAKRSLNEALTALPCGSKVGWAVFTEARSYLLLTPVEVCANRAELRATLAAIDGRMAWSGNSEIAKGLHSAFVMTRDLPGKPSLVFVTDGHEAPPLEPRFKPHFDDKPGDVAGLVVGVGAVQLSPIPKTDPDGRALGFWSAEEVSQVDPHREGRGSSVGGEALSDEAGKPAGGAAVGLGATPGSEHLSSLREAYLRLLAGENGLAFLRLAGPHDLVTALRAPSLARPVETRADVRFALAALALLLVVAPYALAIGSSIRSRRLARRPSAPARAAGRPA